jgi:hypothetical protein
MRVVVWVAVSDDVAVGGFVGSGVGVSEGEACVWLAVTFPSVPVGMRVWEGSTRCADVVQLNARIPKRDENKANRRNKPFDFIVYPLVL